ncbi:MAG: dihydrofolate reductase [Rhodospirillales bacterium]|nr:dihydrofolate reductase [Rhodospirillales bacterium]
MNKSKAPITLSSIVAIAKNHVIGKDNGLIWHLPEDLKHFKRTTLGKPILMGRKSYESLGKPLPGRPNIVVSRAFQNMPNDNPTPIYKDMEPDEPEADRKINEGPFLYASLEDGIAAMKNMAREMGVDEVFITGGGQIYKETLPLTERLYLTVLNREYEGDTFFPEFDWNEWNIAAEEKHPADPANDRPAFTFYTLEKIGANA